MPYKQTINAIRSLKWELLTAKDLERLMFVSLETAKEFAESLRITLSAFPNDTLIKSMAEGELKTNNLKFYSWNHAGDHWEFLQHFLSGHTPPASVLKTCAAYREAISSLPDDIRTMSIFSREKELPDIFSQILTSPAWKNNLPIHLKAFKFYLLKHIELDSEEGGHGDLVGHHTITEDVNVFYRSRIKLYTDTIPKLS